MLKHIYMQHNGSPAMIMQKLSNKILQIIKMMIFLLLFLFRECRKKALTNIVSTL